MLECVAHIYMRTTHTVNVMLYDVYAYALLLRLSTSLVFPWVPLRAALLLLQSGCITA
jgi:hypothetical protein